MAHREPPPPLEGNMHSAHASTAHFAQGLRLDSGEILPSLDIAYRCYGTLNREKTNALLVCHTFTGDHHPAEDNPITGKQGWWRHVIGRGCPIDTDRYFVICQNVIGGCAGSSGPKSINPESGEPYGPDFPLITIGDMVRAQNMLLDHLGINDLFCVIGGSMGGMQVLQWAAAHGERVFSAIPIATSARHTPQNIALHEVCRQVIKADPDWRGGTYYQQDCAPRQGLGVARMAAHITYLSEAALQRKFGRNLQDRTKLSYGFEADFQVESYLRHQGESFAAYFDANSYLYITRAMDYFDLAADYGGQLAQAFTQSETRFCVVSFSSDWLFPTRESVQLVRALNAAGARVSFVEIESDKGHDAFLLEEPEMFATLRGFLQSAGAARGLPAPKAE